MEGAAEGWSVEARRSRYCRGILDGNIGAVAHFGGVVRVEWEVVIGRGQKVGLVRKRREVIEENMDVHRMMIRWILEVLRMVSGKRRWVRERRVRERRVREKRVRPGIGNEGRCRGRGGGKGKGG